MRLYTMSEHYNPKVDGSSPVRGNFLLNLDLFCSNTNLTLMPEWSVSRKPRKKFMQMATNLCNTNCKILRNIMQIDHKVKI